MGHVKLSNSNEWGGTRAPSDSFKTSSTPVGPWVRAGGAAGVAGAPPATVAGSPQTDAPSPASPSLPCASTRPRAV